MNQPGRIVADGAERLRNAGHFAAERRRVSAELARQNESAANAKYFWQRFWLQLKVRRAVRAEMQKRFPPGALHVHIS
jgi:hypothetical protein